MSRIFVSLAAVNTVVLVVAFAAGLGAEPWVVERGAFFESGRGWHLLLGLAAALLTLLVHCVVFSYFLGTGRWVKETAEAYSLPGEIYERTRGSKFRAFPVALVAMLAVIAVAALGAAADTGRLSSVAHLVGACGAIAINFGAYAVELRAIGANTALLDEVMEQVRRIRAARGLEAVGAAGQRG